MNFNELIKNNKQNIKNIVKLITKQENEDIEQEVYIKLWKNSEKYEERGSLKSWVNTVAKNAAYFEDAGFTSIRVNSAKVTKNHMLTAFLKTVDKYRR